MPNHEEDEITSHFSYHDLFYICNKLNKETNKFEQLVFISKDIISSIEFENKNLLREIES